MVLLNVRTKAGKIGDCSTDYSTRNLSIDIVGHRLSFGRKKAACHCRFQVFNVELSIIAI